MKTQIPIFIIISSLLGLLLGCQSDKVAVIMQGEDNPASTGYGDPIPEMDGRPVNLIPGNIPPRVRYRFVENSKMIVAASTLSDFLNTEESVEKYASGIVMVQSGAWNWLKEDDDLKAKKFAEIKQVIPIGNEFEERVGAFAQRPEEVQLVLRSLREIIGPDATIRAMRTQEMSKWWVFIGFDIEEPVLVVETADKTKKFVVSLVETEIFLVDELNSLPDK